MSLLLPLLLMDKRWELKLNVVTKSSQDSPLSERSGNRVAVEVELHDLTPPHQVDFYFIFETNPFFRWTQRFMWLLGRATRETRTQRRLKLRCENVLMLRKTMLFCSFLLPVKRGTVSLKYHKIPFLGLI